MLDLHTERVEAGAAQALCPRATCTLQSQARLGTSSSDGTLQSNTSRGAKRSRKHAESAHGSGRRASLLGRQPAQHRQRQDFDVAVSNLDDALPLVRAHQLGLLARQLSRHDADAILAAGRRQCQRGGRL